VGYIENCGELGKWYWKVFGWLRDFWQNETETVPKRFLVRKVFVGFLVRKVFVGFLVRKVLWVFGVFGPKYGKNASKSVVFGNSCN
jgi:hypothetical protein